MRQMLRERYGGSYLSMAADLGHAAVPIGYVDTNTIIAIPHRGTELGAYYAGGLLRTVAQLSERPEPDYSIQRSAILSEKAQCARAGRACWLTLRWCFHSIVTSMGLEHFALACYDEPDFVREAMQWAERRNQNAVREIIAEVRPDFVLFDGDCAYKTGTMIEPGMMRQFAVEPLRRTIRLLDELGIPCVFHSDGKLDEVIPILIELGIRAVHGCEKQANDLAHLVDTFGDRIVLCGNMDVVFLTHATPEQVREETRTMLRTGSARGRFVAATNTSPQDYVPFENYRAMARAIEESGPC